MIKIKNKPALLNFLMRNGVQLAGSFCFLYLHHSKLSTLTSKEPLEAVGSIHRWICIMSCCTLVTRVASSYVRHKSRKVR